MKKTIFAIVLLSLAARADWRMDECARARLHADRIAELEHTYRGATGFDEFLAQERESLGKALSNLARDTMPTRESETMLEAYFAENDGSAQPFWSHVPKAADGGEEVKRPLLVYLHGYVPYYDIVNVPSIPSVLTSLVARAGACIAAPFGRSNTDFQGPGEQDVLRVIDEMALRHGIDRDRVMLVGYSMGGMGAWSIGGRFAERINAMLILSGRSDYYVWHKVAAEKVPEWQRRIIDTQFGTAWLPRLVEMPILAVHGGQDPLVGIEQGRFPVDALRKLGSKHVELIVLEGMGHQIAIDAFSDPRVAKFIDANLAKHNSKRPEPLGRIPGFTGSRLQDAFLAPFTMIAADSATLARRTAEWRRFAKGEPQCAVERGLESERLRGRAIFIFAEPEDSALAKAVLENSGVEISPASFTFEGKALPRKGHGFWFTGKNPVDPAQTAVVNCGAPWGAGLSENHFYDRIPDVIAYATKPAPTFGQEEEPVNAAAAAGFWNDDGTFSWYDGTISATTKP